MKRRLFVRGSAVLIAMTLLAQAAAGQRDDARRDAETTMTFQLVSIFVEDQDRALAFYTNVMGFVRKQDVPLGEFRWLTVVSPHEPDGTELVLEPNDNSAAKTFQAAMFEQGIPLTAFAVQDIHLEYERLKALGVKFSMEPTLMGSTTLAVLDDTCGNLIQLYENVTRPDLSSRPFGANVERVIAASPDVIYDAWTTTQFDRWFAAPGTVLMKPEVSAPYFFEARFDGQRHPHYGRFLRLVPNRLVEMTWITEQGTRGVETVVTVELTPRGAGTHVRLSHSGFPDEELLKGLEEAWLGALEQLDEAFSPKP